MFKEITGYATLLFCCVLISFLTPTSIAQSDDSIGGEKGRIVLIVTSGSCPKMADESLSKEVAVQAALKEAVRKAAEQLLGPGNTILGSSAFETFLADSYPGFISQYVLQSESQLTNQHLVTISAEVLIGKLSLELYKKEIPFPKPRIMVLIPENVKGVPTPNPGAEAAVIQGLVDNGFDVVDQVQSATIRYSDIVKEAISGSDAKLIEDPFVINQDAEILLVGEAFGDISGQDSGLFAARAKVSLRAIQFDSGKIIAASNCETGGSNTSELLACGNALSSAGSLILGDLIPKLLLTFDPTASNSIILVVKGISFEDLLKFEHDLARNMPGVSSIYRRSYSSNNAEIEIVYSGTGQNLANEFVLTNFTGFKFEVTEFTANKIVLLVKGYDQTTAPTTLRQKEQPTPLVQGNQAPAQAQTAQKPLAQQASGGKPKENADNQLVRLSVYRFDDPFGTGFNRLAADEVGRFLQGLTFIRYVVSDELSQVNQIIADRVNWFNMPPNSFGTPDQVGADWIIIGAFTNVNIEYKYTPPVPIVIDKQQITIPEKWFKTARLDVSMKVIDLKTYEIIKEFSYWATCEDNNQFKANLKSDNAMTKDNLLRITAMHYIPLIQFLYNKFNIPHYVKGKVEGQKNRAIISIPAGYGLYTGMPMMLFWWNSEKKKWEELCKVTVKEIYGSYSVIELSDKWFKFIKLEPGQNYVWPWST